MHEEAEQSEGQEVQEVCIFLLLATGAESGMHFTRNLANIYSSYFSVGKPQALFAKAIAKKSYDKMHSDKATSQATEMDTDE